MQLRTKLIVSDRARPVVLSELSDCQLGAGEDRVMVYVSDLRNRDGSQVEGFLPGYAVGPWAKAQLSEGWVRAEGEDIPHFYFTPRGAWSPVRGFALDILKSGSSRFSIEPL